MKLLVIFTLITKCLWVVSGQFLQDYGQIHADIHTKFADFTQLKDAAVQFDYASVESSFIDPMPILLDTVKRGDLGDFGHLFRSKWTSLISRTCLDDAKFVVNSMLDYLNGTILFRVYSNVTTHNETTEALLREGIKLVTQNFWSLQASKFPSTLQTQHLYSGLCVPATCNNSEVAVIYWAVGTAIDMIKNVPKDNWAEYFSTAKEPNPENNIVCHEEKSIADDPAALAMTIVCSIFLFFMVAGTIYDLFVYQPGLKAHHLRTIASRVSLTVREVLPTTPAPVREFESRLPMYERFFMCFSVYSNGIKVLATEKREGQLDCIHGIRCISMSWVILGHTYFYATQYIDNLLTVTQNMLTEFPTQAILNATVAVDTFLVISGALLSFLWLKETKKNSGRNIKKAYTWFLYYFHRYIRLTPVYMLITGMSIGLFGYVTDGPLWSQDGIEPNRCKNSWYWNLIYLNNFFNLDEKCMGHTWYLADDMQYYILSPIILLAYWFRESIAFALSGILMGVSFGLSAYIMVSNNYSPNGMQSLDFKRFNADQYGYFNQYYIKPYTRCGPYLIGLALGYVMYRLEGKPVKIPRWLNGAIWFGAAAMNVAVLYGLYDVSRGNGMTDWVVGLYSALSRTCWGLGVAWVIFACTTGNGGPVNTFLSWDALKPLSRLTYCAYLCHPQILLITYTGGDRALHFDSHYTMVYYFFANLVMAYGAAFVLSLAFESPIMGLEKLLLPHKGPPPKPTPSQQRIEESDTDQLQPADSSPEGSDSVSVINIESPSLNDGVKRVKFIT